MGSDRRVFALLTLLSAVLIAFTIEFDNESERQSVSAGTPKHFLVSLVFWSNYMRFIREEGVSFGELQRLAQVPKRAVPSRLAALQRWGYVVVGEDGIVRPTVFGRRARSIWRPLSKTIEARWEARFGHAAIDELRGALQTIVARVDVALPHYLPIVGYHMFAEVEPLEREPQHDARPLDLPALLSYVLLALTLDFERKSKLSLPMSANTLRVLDEVGVRVRDLPRLTGTSKEAVAVSVSFLEKNGYVVVETGPTAARMKLARLTQKGSEAQSEYHRLLGAFEERWEARFGADEFRRLRDALEVIVDQRDGERPRMAEGLRPYPGGWRQRKPYATQVEAVLRGPREALPHYPMVLHRGGWPDGS